MRATPWSSICSKAPRAFRQATSCAPFNPTGWKPATCYPFHRGGVFYWRFDCPKEDCVIAPYLKTASERLYFVLHTITQSYLRELFPTQLLQHRDGRHLGLNQSLPWHDECMLEGEASAQ